MILSETQVKSLLYNAGFRGAALNAAVKIAQCESGFNTLAWNRDGEDSRGLMQINVSPSANPQYATLDLFDPVINTQVAYQIYLDWGKNFKAWTCARILNLENPSNFYGIGIAFIIGSLLYSL